MVSCRSILGFQHKLYEFLGLNLRFLLDEKFVHAGNRRKPAPNNIDDRRNFHFYLTQKAIHFLGSLLPGHFELLLFGRREGGKNILQTFGQYLLYLLQLLVWRANG